MVTRNYPNLTPFLLVIFLLVTLSTTAQNRFNAGAVVGFNLAQIDGDDHSGYRKFGLQGGLRGVAVLNKELQFSVEMLYSRRGSRSKKSKGEKYKLELDLTYVELPFLFNVLTKEKGEKKRDRYHSLHLYLGASYGRLFSANVDENIPRKDPDEDIIFSNYKEDYNKNDVSFVIGANYFFNKNMGINFRHSFSLIPLYKSSNFGGRYPSLNGYFGSLQLIYML